MARWSIQCLAFSVIRLVDFSLFLVTNFVGKGGQIVHFLGYFEKHQFPIKQLWLLFGNYLKILGYFLLQHLVTLPCLPKIILAVFRVSRPPFPFYLNILFYFLLKFCWLIFNVKTFKLFLFENAIYQVGPPLKHLVFLNEAISFIFYLWLQCLKIVTCLSHPTPTLVAFARVTNNRRPEPTACRFPECNYSTAGRSNHAEGMVKLCFHISLQN